MIAKAKPRKREVAPVKANGKRCPNVKTALASGQYSLILRSCRPSLISRDDFKWPSSGYVEVAKWDPDPKRDCGGGLHGFLWGCGRPFDTGAYLESDARWLVVLVPNAVIVAPDAEIKCRFRHGWVIYCGDIGGATSLLDENGAVSKPVIFATRTASGDGGQATASGYGGQATASGLRGQATASGDGGQATASGYGGQATASGYRGQATASGYRGQATASGEGGQATASGLRGQATASGEGGQATASGYGGQATASGLRGQATASGEGGQATASGLRGQVRAGDLGAIQLRWFDYEHNRYRIVTGYVGENGIKPNVFYRLGDAHEFVEVPNE